jgi:CubicO group peptidase (beta-lactamase class C family)
MAAHGTCDPRFARVGEELERSFAERGEVGASVAVTLDGETVVDLWGGIADPATGREWTADTLSNLFSCTKGATALCAHLLADRGELDLDAPVSAVWPEFAKNGKDRIPVRQLLCHQAGLPALREPLPEGALYDWDLMADRLAAEEPFWEPGTRHGYHALTFGFLVGEVVRRVSGAPLGTFFREQVAGPLDLDLWLGLPEEDEHRVAPTIPAAMPESLDELPVMHRTAMADMASLQGLVLANNGGYLLPGEADTRAAHAADMGSVGAIGNGRSLAGMYRPLALDGSIDRVRLVGPAEIARMGAVASAGGVDAVVLVPSRWSLGFMKGVDNRHLPGIDASSILLSDVAFGHAGMGGSLGFADPGARMSFGYSMNQQGLGVAMHERGQALVDAVYESLGYRLAPGGWYQ